MTFVVRGVRALVYSRHRAHTPATLFKSSPFHARQPRKITIENLRRSHCPQLICKAILWIKPSVFVAPSASRIGPPIDLE
jgi:hypothetical protein